MLICSRCNKIVANFDLYKGSASVETCQSKQLFSCKRCEAESKPAVLCATCESQDNRCSKHYDRYKRLSDGAMNIIKQTKFHCVFCDEKDKFYHPLELRDHFLRDCPNFYKEY